MTKSFTHLHVHTEYSMLDGASRLGELISAAKADGQNSIGITDHGNLYGALEFYKQCKEQEMVPVIGTEAYFENGSRFDRPKRSEMETYHLTLLAENNTGYENLVKVSSKAYLDGFYYKPRTDWELLEEHSEGLIATSGCLGGLVNQLIMKDEFDAALKAASRFQDIFGNDNFFIELQDHGLKEDAQVLPHLIEIANKIKAPLIATNDSHYTDRADAHSHDALLCVQTGSLMSDTNRFKFEAEEFYVKSAAEMRHLFRDYEQACDNTLLIASRSNVDFEFGKIVLPSFPVPDGYSEESYLRELVYEGAKQRWGDSLTQEISERIEFELKVIKDMGFPAYFLIVWDLVKFAKENDIRVGPGRGSAAGSAVAYCLKIVDIDPIKYDLLFERFLNPGRKEMPDIDMDFDSRYRGEMIKYASARYGWDHVAQIITFSTIKARAAVRDSARVLGYPYAVGDKIAKLMPPLILGRDTPIWACFEKHEKYSEGYGMAAELRSLYESDADAKRIIDIAKGLEGLRRQDGIHAAAVVIAPDTLTNFLPVQRKPVAGGDRNDAPLVTQFEMNGVADLGLLKMDFLGLRNLDVMDIALKQIEKSRSIKVDIDNVDLNDEKTFELLRNAQTIGVFQLEGGAMRSLIRSLQPTRFEDVSALVALYRPGPMAANMHLDYANRKNGRQKITYYHEDVKDILEPTFGLMIYQEQLMRVAQKLANYTLEEADNLRKAMGKKKREIIKAHREKFAKGCEENGYGTKFGHEMFDIIEPFADYSFNKSHSVGYGFIAYQTAYLKANYPEEYLAALLTSTKGDKDRAAIYLAECRQLGIEVHVPDINESDSDFTVVDGVIRFGMSAVRNVGEGLVALIVKGREETGLYKDFYDFCERVDTQALNKRTVESLIKAGAFDNLGHTRQGLLMVYEQILENTIARRREQDLGIMSLFGEVGSDSNADSSSRIAIPDTEFEKNIKLQFEKEMLGLYISDHPLSGVGNALAALSEKSVAQAKESNEGDTITVGGVITSLTKRYTKRGDLMATFVLEDLAMGIEVMVFPKTMEKYSDVIVEDKIILLTARVDAREEVVKLIAVDFSTPDLSLDGSGPPIRIQTSASSMTKARADELREMLSRYPGNSPVYLHLVDKEKTTVVRFGVTFTVEPSSSLFAELHTVMGDGCIL
ncbi:MAG: DNA polymerase III subunit alpha [Acidimicrobiia bacterium]